MRPDLETSAEHQPKPTAIERLVERMRGTPKGVRIQGADGLMVRYAQCCQPVPGRQRRRLRDARTRGEHPSRRLPEPAHARARAGAALEIDWQQQEGERFIVRLVLEGIDRRGLYADIAGAVSGAGTDIRSMELKTSTERSAGPPLVESRTSRTCRRSSRRLGA
jgi:GTP pyrophosphokinase